jgi:hypothetical protein
MEGPMHLSAKGDQGFNSPQASPLGGILAL